MPKERFSSVLVISSLHALPYLPPPNHPLNQLDVFAALSSTAASNLFAAWLTCLPAWCSSCSALALACSYCFFASAPYASNFFSSLSASALAWSACQRQWSVAERLVSCQTYVLLCAGTYCLVALLARLLCLLVLAWVVSSQPARSRRGIVCILSAYLLHDATPKHIRSAFFSASFGSPPAL